MNLIQARAALKCAANLSQLSRDSGISLPTLQRIKRGHDAKASTLAKLEEYFTPTNIPTGKKKEKARA